MASSAPAGAALNESLHGDQKMGFALTALTFLFFLWGFITCLNDVLIPHLKNVFNLNYTEAMLIQFCFFGAYFLMSVPAGILVKRLSFKTGIVIGLAIAGIGCLSFVPAAQFRSYPMFLGALFILASGITILQVAANPYVTLLGPAQTASSRLTMTQAFNSLGTTVAPFFGAALILSGATVAVSELQGPALEAFQAQEAEAIKLPYIMLASALFALSVLFLFLRLPVPKVDEQVVDKNAPSILNQPHLVLGALGIFLYVGAEVAIGSFLVNFLGEEHIANMPEAEAANYIAIYWGGAMVGRFIGALVMQKVAAGVMLTLCALGSALLVTLGMLSSGALAMWAILLVGLCNSIMFPTIFSLALNKLGPQTSQGSGLLCLAIVGGAVVPLMQGILADVTSLQTAFVLPLLCYLYIAFYGMAGSKVRTDAA